MKISKRALYIIAILLVLSFAGTAAAPVYQKINHRLQIYRVARDNEKTIAEFPSEEEKPTTASALPTQKLLEVGFICQAPMETEENWTYHEESCEEAAFLQAYLYETGQTITKPQAHEKILDMIVWQIDNFGTHHDLYADEMQKFITGYGGLTDDEVVTVNDVTVNDIQSIIAAGHPIIAPVTAATLKNPHYPYPGYHMLTITGYTEDRIITNDNGTRHGKSFSYDTAIFMQALRDAGGFIIYLNIP